MTVTAAAWIVGYAPCPPLQWVNAFTAYVYLPAYAIAMIGWLAGRRRLAVCGAALTCWHVMVILSAVTPPNRPINPASASLAAGSQTVRVFYANIGKSSGHRDAMFDEIRESDADILVLTEFTESWHNEFNTTELPAEYPHHIHLTQYGPAATGVYARQPLTHDERVYQAKRVVVRTAAQLERTELTIYAIHGPRPVRSPLHKYDEYWGIVLHELQQEPGPLLLIGDFNATPFSLIYRRITRGLGLRDCHLMAGRGWATTWPNGASALPPIRIDHGFVTPGLECIHANEGVGLGSDHKPLVLDLVIPAPTVNVEMGLAADPQPITANPAPPALRRGQKEGKSLSRIGL